MALWQKENVNSVVATGSCTVVTAVASPLAFPAPACFTSLQVVIFVLERIFL